MENYNYSAQEVANAFLQQYYRIMQRAPKDGFNFYKEQSIRSHQCADGSMKTATTLQGINDDIMASNIKQWNPDLTTVHAQDSVMESVFVGVLGYLTDNAGVERNFTQTFVLAPQEGGGFYVHNDFLQFLDVIMSSIASLPAWQQAPNKKAEAKNVSYTSLLTKEGSGSSTTTTENIYDDKAIRVKNLPPNMTSESLLKVVKQFGPVKQNGIHIKEYAKDGYRYAFVEFDDPKSARSAIEARFIHFEDRYSEIQYKKLPNQGGHYYNARPSYGCGGYRNNNLWGRDGEGRSNGSWGYQHHGNENFGQTREYYYMCYGYSQDHW
ncbi:putative Ras GTPase-activating protein-binding protein [Helianthus annuus]|nr:putative Ras GTPase-activating protein-binding protein [Helianthus annuus]